MSSSCTDDQLDRFEIIAETCSNNMVGSGRNAPQLESAIVAAATACSLISMRTHSTQCRCVEASANHKLDRGYETVAKTKKKTLDDFVKRHGM